MEPGSQRVPLKSFVNPKGHCIVQATRNISLCFKQDPQAYALPRASFSLKVSNFSRWNWSPSSICHLKKKKGSSPRKPVNRDTGHLTLILSIDLLIACCCCHFVYGVTYSSVEAPWRWERSLPALLLCFQCLKWYLIQSRCSINICGICLRFQMSPSAFPPPLSFFPSFSFSNK